jgi:GTP cyclohydrolase II
VVCSSISATKGAASDWFDKIRAYALQDGGLDTVDANVALGLPVDGRDYTAAAEVLRKLGVRRARVLTNNPAKLEALEQHGVEVVERVPIEALPNPVNLTYLRTRRTGWVISWVARRSCRRRRARTGTTHVRR